MYQMDDLSTLRRARCAAKDGRARALRIQAALTQHEVAGMCGVSAATVSRWETGLRVPRGLAALRWARLVAVLGEEADDVDS